MQQKPIYPINHFGQKSNPQFCLWKQQHEDPQMARGQSQTHRLKHDHGHTPCGKSILPLGTGIFKIIQPKVVGTGSKSTSDEFLRVNNAKGFFFVLEPMNYGSRSKSCIYWHGFMAYSFLQQCTGKCLTASSPGEKISPDLQDFPVSEV